MGMDLQKFIDAAGESEVINLDVSLGQVVRSNAFRMLQAYDDPWEWFCGNDFRFMIWPGPRLNDVSVINQQTASRLRETLGVAHELGQTLNRLKG